MLPAAAEARQYLIRALELARKTKTYCRGANCHYHYGRIFALAGDAVAAEKSYRRAIAMFEKIWNRKNLSDIYIEYAKMRSGGAPEKSSCRKEEGEYFKMALSVYREAGLPHRIKPVRQAIGRED